MAKTLFLSVPAIRKLVAQVGFEALYRKLADRLTEDFKRWPEFDKSKRFASYSPQGVIELMPIADASRFSFKYVNGHPKNYTHGMATVMAFGCLSDVDTGFPLLLSEMTILTAIRTAATSAIAARALANPGTKAMALIGNGAQSEFQALAFHHLLGIDRFHLHDPDHRATRRLISNLEGDETLILTPFESAEETIQGCEIITTATASKKHQQVLTAPMVRPGTHLNAIGGDCPGKTELDLDLLVKGKVFVEYAPQARIEGEIQQMSPDFAVTELWEVLTGALPGRTNPSDITVFDSVGFSLEDYSTLGLVYDLGREEGIGEEIELIPDMVDVKDLFSCLTLR